MKVKNTSYRGNRIEYATVKEAVEDALTPDAYSYDGKLEGLGARIDLLQKMVAALIDCRYGKQKLDHEQLQDILGYGYEVEE